MKLGVSNLAWTPGENDAAMSRLAALGVSGIEVAPTRIDSWDNLSSARAVEYRQAAHRAGLEVSSLQAIFFGRPAAQLLGDASAFQEMVEHTRRVAGVAEDLGAGVAVFGAPRNRIRGMLSTPDADSLAVERLRILGDIAQEHGLAFGMEPVPSFYGSDYLQRAAEVRRMVAMCDHPAVRTHLDCACVTLAGDDIAEEVAETGVALLHYHIAEPGLGSFAEPSGPHVAASAALRQSGYVGWLVIEMSPQPTGLIAVENAVEFAHEVYGP